MRRLVFLIALATAGPAALASSVELEARFWTPDLGGSARIDGGGTGTTIDLVSDLGFSDDDALEGRLVWRPTRRTSLRLELASFDFTGDAVLSRTITFSGTSFALDARVASGLQLEYGGIGFAWQFLSTGDGRLRLGPLLEARGLRGDAAITAEVQGLVSLGAREEFELAFGAAGVALDVEPARRVHLYARWTSSVAADEGDLTDAEAGVRFAPIPALALTVGYRRIEIDAASGGDLFDLDLDGPFFGGVARF